MLHVFISIIYPYIYLYTQIFDDEQTKPFFSKRQVAGMALPAVATETQSSKSMIDPDLMDNLYQNNPICADCQGKRPEWASMNLGILICIECSGIHRSLGVHISKVRSLTLDKWSNTAKCLMKEMGNSRSNAVWEAAVPQGRTKPGENASREERELWIRDKYVRRRFVAKVTEESVDKELYHAAEAGDLERIMWALAHQANINYAVHTTGRTPVHAVCVGGHLACLELLYQNGCNLDVADNEEITPLDLAMMSPHGNQDIISFVVSKLER